MEFKKSKKRPVEILVLGKIGVGKSSFINYILELKEGNTAYCKTGAGERTTERGIFKKEGRIDGIPFNLYDSMGLEASDQDEQKRWIDMIEYFFNPEGREKPAYQVDIPSRGFCHSVFYCLDSSVKVENNDIDKKMIKVISNDFKQQVTIILTKVDVTPKSTVDALENALYEEFGKNKIYVIKTATLSGEIEDVFGEIRKLRTSGINQVRAEILINFLNSLPKWLPKDLMKDFRTALKVDIDFYYQSLTKNAKGYISSLNEQIKNLDMQFLEKIQSGCYRHMSSKKNNELLVYPLENEIRRILDQSKINEEITSFCLKFDEISEIFLEKTKEIDYCFKFFVQDWFEDLSDLSNIFGLGNLNLDIISLNLKEVESMPMVKVIDSNFNLLVSVKTMSDLIRWIIGILTFVVIRQAPVSHTNAVYLGFLVILYQIFKKNKGELKKIKNDLIQQAYIYIDDLDRNINDRLAILNYINNILESYDKSEEEVIDYANKIVINKDELRENARLQDGLK